MSADSKANQSAQSRFLKEFCDGWLDAWNSHETDRVLALMHPEIEWDDRTFWPQVVNGHGELRTYVEKIWEVMHDVRFEERQRFYAPDFSGGVVLFQQCGSAPERLGSGSFDVHGCDIFLEFEDCKLRRYLASYEICEMMRQLGALPPREGRIGGAYLLSLLGGRGDSRSLASNR